MFYILPKHLEEIKQTGVCSVFDPISLVVDCNDEFIMTFSRSGHSEAVQAYLDECTKLTTGEAFDLDPEFVDKALKLYPSETFPNL